MPEYMVVFDVSRDIYLGWLVGLFGLLPTVLCVVAWGWGLDTRLKKIGAVVTASLCLLVTVTMIGSSLRDYFRMRADYEAGRYTLIEGPVENFQRDFDDGKSPQTFSVNGVEFEVRGASPSPGFRRTVGQGGPDLSGQCVRILYTTHAATDRKEIIWLGTRKCGPPVEIMQ